MYADAHCHLGSRQYDNDRKEVVGRMLEAGVGHAILICCSRHDLLESVKLREQNPGFRLALSIHPQDLEDDYGEERLQQLQRDIEEYRPDMIGETGLDYYSHPHTKTQQIHFFISQLELARKFDLPVNIHSRKASKDTLDILKEHPCRGIIHSYSGSVEMARLYMKEGYYISLGASVLFPNARRPRQVAAALSLDRLLIETDSPYQSPVLDHRHEPADIVNIYEEISRIRNMETKELEAAVEENFLRVFRK
ncbi:MAG: TatD family deoxyribonuclease [Erysipelotrichaceae bacterium]|nr:TatD family deoxyribonuclease [Erysipelotrichaceae bacterium]